MLINVVSRKWYGECLPSRERDYLKTYCNKGIPELFAEANGRAIKQGQKLDQKHIQSPDKDGSLPCRRETRSVNTETIFQPLSLYDGAFRPDLVLRGGISFEVVCSIDSISDAARFVVFAAAFFCGTGVSPRPSISTKLRIRFSLPASVFKFSKVK